MCDRCSGLSMANVLLTLPEMAAVQRQYRSQKKEGAFDYVQFCKDVESVFTTDSLHLDPLGEAEKVCLRDETLVVDFKGSWKLQLTGMAVVYTSGRSRTGG